MEIPQFKELIQTGREIEFVYGGKKYSVTYAKREGTEIISFCEFYKEPTEVESVDDLLKIMVNGETLEIIIPTLTDEDVWIY